jgi:hypothetical protein
MNKKILWALGLVALLTLVTVISVAAVSGAAFTTFNAHVDGSGKDVCKNSAINCNIYGDKTYVWLNGGPAANGLGPDGQYFFTVLEPGGQPNPNDQDHVKDKNLSDDYDCYQNRIFTVTNGEVSAYAGNYDCSTAGYTNYTKFRHWLDDGKSGAKPNWKVPYIRLYPYSDTTNPGGVYIMAICSLDKGYPVEPRDCKYDAFKVKKGKLPYSFMLSGIKFQDTYADGVKDPAAIDPGLSGWTIKIDGTGPDGNPIHETRITGPGGYWEFQSMEYFFSGGAQPVPFSLQVCEELQSGWYQSYPTPSCYTVNITPVAGSFDSVGNLDFGNYQPVDVTACKVRDLDGVPGGNTVPVPGWMVTLTENGNPVDTQATGSDGCYTWTQYPPGTPLKPGISYDLHEEMKPGWEALGATDYVFPKARSGESFSHTFVNAVLQGCTPGFWQGGPDKPDAKAGGALLWDGDDTLPWDGPFLPPPHVDAQWVASGGANPPGNPYIHVTLFNDFFTPYSGLNGFDMFSLVGSGGGPNDYQKAARDLVAAYLNSSWGMNYPYSTKQLNDMWANAVATGDFMSLHLTLDAANNSGADTNGDGLLEHQCPISASIQ